jgi:prohibitin 1
MDARLQRIGQFFMSGSIGLGVLAGFAKACLFTVDGGHRAVMWDRIRGVLINDVRGEGMHFKIPFIQKTTMYEVRTRFANIQSETGSRDLQTVVLTLRMLYRPLPEKLPIIHQNYGPDYDERILPSIGNEVLKSVVAKYDAGELITQREFVSTNVREVLTERAAEFNIILDDVSITHLSFSPEFTQAIEAKQVAQQEAERAKYVVSKSEQEKLAAVIRASGEAEAAKLIGQGMKLGNGFIELRKIEALKEIADILSRSRNVTYLPNNTSMLLNIPGGVPRPQQQQ